jgi:SAM-dependent methyltransferase
MSFRLKILVSGLFVLALTGLAFVQGFDSGEVDRIVEVLDIEPGEVVADVGAGDGRWSQGLAERVGESGRVYATEVDPGDLKRIRERVARAGLDNVIVVEGRQDDTGLPPTCCDAILLRRVYHHFQDPAAMRRSLRQALRADGLLLIVDFDPRGRWGRPEGVPESRGGHGIDDGMVVSEMEGDGFELVRELDWRGNDYALLFRASTETNP